MLKSTLAALDDGLWHFPDHDYERFSGFALMACSLFGYVEWSGRAIRITERGRSAQRRHVARREHSLDVAVQ